MKRDRSERALPSRCEAHSNACRSLLARRRHGNKTATKHEKEISGDEEAVFKIKDLQKRGDLGEGYKCCLGTGGP